MTSDSTEMTPPSAIASTSIDSTLHDPIPVRWVLLVLAVGSAGLFSKSIAVLTVAIIGAVFLTPWAGWVILAFFAWTSGLCGILDYEPLDFGVFNVYASDFILVVFTWTLLHLMFNRSRGAVPRYARLRERRLTGIWGVWTLLGILFIINGYYIHNTPFDRAFGDLRRATVYSAAFFIPLLFPFRPKQLRATEWAIYAGGLIVIAIGAYRISTGSAARVDENYETGHLSIRLMGISECMTLACMLALLTIQWRTGARFVVRAVSLLFMAACAVLLLLSGFRLAMAFVVAVPAVTLILVAWARRENLVRLGWIVLRLLIVAAPVALALAAVFSQQFEKMFLDLHLRLVNNVVEGGFRHWAFGAALDSFWESPILGQGFGYYLTVATRNQSGLFDYVEMNNPHNMFLGVLYQTGIVGFIPFVLFHLLFLRYALLWIHHVNPAYRRTYLALLVTYGCYMAYMNTQPYVSSQFILLYMVMGFMVRLARPAPGELRQPTLAQQP